MHNHSDLVTRETYDSRELLHRSPNPGNLDQEGRIIPRHPVDGDLCVLHGPVPDHRGEGKTTADGRVECRAREGATCDGFDYIDSQKTSDNKTERGNMACRTRKNSMVYLYGRPQERGLVAVVLQHRHSH